MRFGLLPKSPLHLCFQGHVVGVAVRIRQEPLVLGQLRSANGLAQLAEQVIIAAADHERSVRGLERIERRHVRMAVAKSLRRLAGCRVMHQALLEEGERPVEHRHVDTAPFAGLFARIKCGGDAAEHEYSSDEIGDRSADTGGRSIRKSRKAHEAAHALNDGVVSRKRLERSGLAETSGGRIDQAGIEFGQLLIREAEAVHGARPEIFGENVGLPHHVEEDGAVGILLEIQGDALLPAVDKAEVQRLALVEGTESARVITVAGRLDLDHARAEIGQDRRSEWAVQHVCQVDDEQAREGPCNVLGLGPRHWLMFGHPVGVGQIVRSDNGRTPVHQLS